LGSTLYSVPVSDIEETGPSDALLRRYMWGDEESVQRFHARRRNPVSAPHAEMMGPANAALWGRDVLPLKTVALANVAILAALNRPAELHTRFRGLLRAGVPAQELAEICYQVAFYAGNPAGVEALTSLVDAVDENAELTARLGPPRTDV